MTQIRQCGRRSMLQRRNRQLTLTLLLTANSPTAFATMTMNATNQLRLQARSDSARKPLASPIAPEPSFWWTRLMAVTWRSADSPIGVQPRSFSSRLVLPTAFVQPLWVSRLITSILPQPTTRRCASIVIFPSSTERHSPKRFMSHIP